MRQRAKVDDNHSAVVAALEAMGWLVWSTARLGEGFPDLVIAKAGRLVLLEVKDGEKPPSRRRLTEDEIGCHMAFRAHGIHIHIVESVADLAQLDREARTAIEGGPARNFYGD